MESEATRAAPLTKCPRPTPEASMSAIVADPYGHKRAKKVYSWWDESLHDMVCVYIQRKLTFARRISPVASSEKWAVVSWWWYSFNVTPLQIESGFHQLLYFCYISPSYTLPTIDLFQFFAFALHCVFSLPWWKAELESGAAICVSRSTFFFHIARWTVLLKTTGALQIFNPIF